VNSPASAQKGSEYRLNQEEFIIWMRRSAWSAHL